VNKYRFGINQIDRNINIPIEIDFDLSGKEDLITSFEKDVIERVANPIKDFEVVRYRHEKWTNFGIVNTKITYNFLFYDRSIDIRDTTSANVVNWVADYGFTTNPSSVDESFTDLEIYYSANSFRRSFFKLDFYDTSDSETQKLYFTVIIPTQQGLTETVDIGTEEIPREVEIKTPKFVLDIVGDKEGYFIYWLKKPEKLNISPFYMSAKFFNAKTGQFIRMLNKPQATIPQKFSFDKSKFLYYKVFMNYNNYTYEVFNPNTNKREGTTIPIRWYEYINP
jgi:hypothetical protein